MLYFISVCFKLCETDTELQWINTQILHLQYLIRGIVYSAITKLMDLHIEPKVPTYKVSLEPQLHQIQTQIFPTFAQTMVFYLQQQEGANVKKKKNHSNNMTHLEL